MAEPPIVDAEFEVVQSATGRLAGSTKRAPWPNPFHTLARQKWAPWQWMFYWVFFLGIMALVALGARSGVNYLFGLFGL